MNKKIRHLAAGICPFAFATMGVMAGVPGESEKPNILFILMDDLGWTDVASGSRFYETPNIDKLAGESLRFTQAYSCGPNCAPSRASLLTGKYTPRHGIFTVGEPNRGKDSTLRKLIAVPNERHLKPGFVTIAEELKAAGYATGLIGKWQLGNKEHKTDPASQGFDFVISGDGGTSSYFYPFYKGKKPDKPVHEGLGAGKEGDYLTDRLTDEAVRFIKTDRDNPFFLYLSHFAVHTPIQAKPEKIGKYRNKEGDGPHDNPEYAAMLESADENVGRVLKALEEADLDQNTIVIFFSDNGGYGGVTAQPPLRGAKGMLYEGGIRVPLFIRWPGVVDPGQETDTPVIGIDFYPTLLQAAGIEQPLNPDVDGKSFLPLLKGAPAPEREAIFWHFPAYLENGGNNKTTNEPFRTRPVSVIRSGDFKLFEFYEDGHAELYNIKEDIGEQTDLSTVLPRKAGELYQKLQEWKKEVQAPVPTLLNPNYKPLPVTQ